MQSTLWDVSKKSSLNKLILGEDKKSVLSTHSMPKYFYKYADIYLIFIRVK